MLSDLFGGLGLRRTWNLHDCYVYFDITLEIIYTNDHIYIHIMYIYITYMYLLRNHFIDVLKIIEALFLGGKFQGRSSRKEEIF